MLIDFTLSGGIAGICVDLVLFPIDSIKTRLQASDPKTNYSLKASKISKYRGLQSSMAASFPCAGIFWLTYECTKLSTSGWLPEGLVPSVAAIVAEATQALVRNPFEVIKTNMQIGEYSTLRRSLMRIYQDHGIAGTPFK